MTPFERKRLAAGLTQRELADKLGVTQRAVAKWERPLGSAESSIPSPRMFPKLARVFRMTPEQVTHLFDAQPATAPTR